VLVDALKHRLERSSDSSTVVVVVVVVSRDLGPSTSVTPGKLGSPLFFAPAAG
jgi:hypothetical protein